MNDAFERLSSPAALRDGWKRVRANKGAAGGDGQSMRAFSRGLDGRLRALSRQLRDGTYRPGPLRRVEMAKPGGGVRELRIPCVRDRVAQSAAARVLEEIFDPLMHDASFAYRPGRHVYQAAGRIADFRLRGYEWVVRCDIRDCFGSIAHDLLLRRLRENLGESRTIALVSLWLRGFSPHGRGIAQGSPLSPLLANIYLSPVDRGMQGRKTGFVRYADDYLLLARSEAAARNLMSRLRRLLRPLGMELAAEKTTVTTFGEGFEFLGFAFHGSEIVRLEAS